MWIESFNRKYIASAALIVVAILVVWLATILPSTNMYRALVRTVWSRGYPGIAYELNQTDPTLAMAAGNYYFGGGTYNLTRATDSFQLAVRLDPTILWGHYQLARIYFVQSHFDRALSEINAELVANPANLRSLYVSGLIYMYRGQPGDLNLAAADFERFIPWAPTEWAGYNDLAFVLAEEGKYAGSESVLREAFANVPNANKNSWLWNGIGLDQLNEHHYAAAVLSFEHAATFARTLTPSDWQNAYSADNPASDSSSIVAFQNAIAENLLISREKAN